MIIDGETYACEGCIRGHRTRNCQHKDRPLQLISKKGRPVSQCNHCRSERKSRSAHVKCQCGKSVDGTGGCGCHSGGRCTCATKKSPKQETPKMDAVPEFSGSESLGSPAMTDPTLSNPAQITSTSNMHWQDMASPTLGYPMDGTGTDAGSGMGMGMGTSHFDGNMWLGGDNLQPPSAMMSQTFSGNFMGNGNHGGGGGEPNTHDLGINAAPYQQQFDANLDMTHMGEWPSVDSDATKEFLGLLDSSGADLGLSANGWDSNNLFPMAHGHDPPEMMFNTTEYSSPGQAAGHGQNKKDQGGGGGCCS